MKKDKAIEITKKVCDRYKRIINVSWLPIIMIELTIVIFLIGRFMENYNISIMGIFIFCIYTIFYSLGNVNKRFLLLIMNVMMFTFILSRPVIRYVTNTSAWFYSSKTMWKVIIGIMIAEIFLFLGGLAYEKISGKKEKKETYKNNYNGEKFEKILFIIIIVTACISGVVELVKYFYMKNYTYELNYTNKAIQFPIVIRTIASMYVYLTYAYLATLPKKKKSLIVLTIYVILAIPSFLLGSRNSLILRALFALVYVIIRNIKLQENEVWLRDKSKNIIIVMIPLVVIIMGAYNYIRSDKEVVTFSPVGLTVDFFFNQGTTFDTICQGFGNEKKLKNAKNVISYSFGDIIDYTVHNTISNKLFHTENLGSGNSMIMVEKSNSMAHRLSYIVLGKITYLSGHGRGTSYIIETYMDGGFIYVAVYSFVIGVFLASVLDILKKRDFLIRYIVLTALSQIFLIPRYSASGFISFIVNPEFWVVALIVILLKNKIVDKGVENE